MNKYRIFSFIMLLLEIAMLILSLIYTGNFLLNEVLNANGGFVYMCSNYGGSYCTFNNSLLALFVFDIILLVFTTLLIALYIFKAPIIQIRIILVSWALIMIGRQITNLVWDLNDLNDDIRTFKNVGSDAYRNCFLVEDLFMKIGGAIGVAFLGSTSYAFETNK